MALTSADSIKEGKTIPSGALDHENGRRSFRELHKMHDEKLQQGALSAPNRLNKGDERRYISGPMNTSKNTELVLGFWAGSQVSQLAVRAGGHAAGWFVDGHDSRSCDEGCKECHEDQNSKHLVIEHLFSNLQSLV